MKLILAPVILFLVMGVTAGENGTSAISETSHLEVHSRQKRYIVFPKGASLQLLLELLVHVPTQFRLLIGPTIQIGWSLPSEPMKESPSAENPDLDQNLKKKIFSFSNNKHSSPWKGNRYKIFNDIAAAMNLFGMTVGLAWQLPDDPKIYAEYKKKHKIYKRNALKKMEGFLRPGGADGRQCVLRALCESGQRTPAKKDFLREILHKIFSFSEHDEDTEETHEDKIYRKAHQSINQNCEALYPDCNFSVFNHI